MLKELEKINKKNNKLLMEIILLKLYGVLLVTDQKYVEVNGN